MPTDFAFRLSMYLSMVLACLCLGYAELDFLPEVTVFSGVVITLLVVSFALGGRYELDLRAANHLGLAIGIVAALWLAYQFFRQDSLIYTFPWPASLLPYLGPLLMILMPAKLFRPKHTGDWWTLQGLALAAVGLATAMAEDFIFGVLLGAYGLCVIWSLTLFYFRRSAGLLPPINPDNQDPVPIVVSPAEYVGRVLSWQTVLWNSLSRLVIALIISLPIFFLVPRSNAPRWQFANYNIETGLGESQVDLSRTGQMRVNREIAFTIYARYPDGRGKTELSTNQRWRAASYSTYQDKRWLPKPLDSSKSLLDRSSRATQNLPEGSPYPPALHPEQYLLDIEAADDRRMAFRIFKDPVRWVPRQAGPIAVMSGDRWRTANQDQEGHFLLPSILQGRLPKRYQQVSYDLPEEEQDLSQAFELPLEEHQAIFQNSANAAVNLYRRVEGLPRIRELAVDLLNKFATQDPRMNEALKRADTRRGLQLDPLDYEVVASALQKYLSTSPEFKYSLTIKRTDLKLDPVEDFLLKSKTGHCERFASGMALLCRSLGIPALYVIGYRGCEPSDVPGVYNVRQDDAHAWVEVLVPRPRGQAPPPAPDAPTYVWHWLSLDPTPGQSDDEANNPITDWFGSAKDSSIGFFLDFIIGYNPERRQRAVATINKYLSSWWWAALVPVVALVILLILDRSRRRKRILERLAQQQTTTTIPWIDEFLRCLERHHASLPPGKTWKEYQPELAARLGNDPEAESHLDLLIQAIYQQRYAGQSTRDTTALENVVTNLDRAFSTPAEAPQP